MIITSKHRQRAEEILEQGNTELAIQDTLKIIYCLVPEEHKVEVEAIYNNIYTAQLIKEN